MHLWWENKVEYICTEGRAVLSHNLDGRAYCTALTGLLSNCSPQLSCWFKFSQPVCCWAGMKSTSFSDGDLSLFKNLPFLQLEITFEWLFINRDTKLSCIRAIRAWIVPRNTQNASAKNSFRKEVWGGRKKIIQLFPVESHSFPSLRNHLVNGSHAQRPTQYLVLEHGSPKGPDSSKDKIELIKFLGTVWRGVFWSQQTLQQVAQHLDHTLLRDRDDLLKPEQRQTHCITRFKHYHGLVFLIEQQKKKAYCAERRK